MTVRNQGSPDQRAPAREASKIKGADIPKAKIVIRDSSGDDVLIISGDHHGELIDADLGTGNDRIVRTEKDYSFKAQASSTGLTWSGIIVLATLALALCSLIAFAYRRHAR